MRRKSERTGCGEDVQADVERSVEGSDLRRSKSQMGSDEEGHKIGEARRHEVHPSDGKKAVAPAKKTARGKSAPVVRPRHRKQWWEATAPAAPCVIFPTHNRVELSQSTI